MGTIYLGVAAKTFLPPIANAGDDQSFSLPTTTTTLIGSGSAPSGVITTYAWTKVSGPSCTITSPSSVTTGVTGMTSAGTYTFQLVVTDNNGNSGLDEMSITVASITNIIITGTISQAADNFTVRMAMNIPASVDIICTFTSQYIQDSITRSGPSGIITILAGTTSNSGGFGSINHGLGTVTSIIFLSLGCSPTTADGRTVSTTF